MEFNEEVFGQRIRKLRQDMGISMESMAAKLDVTTNYLGKIERGMRCPSLGFVIRLSRILGISTDYLLMGVNSVPRATLARTFSHTLTGKQPHRHGGQPHPENSSIMISAHGIV